jgi:hypothetical protein
MCILFIDIDSLRPDHLGCYGYHRNTSPNVERLRETARKEHADRIERTRGFVDGSVKPYLH